MQRLEKYLEEEQVNRIQLIGKVNRNMENISAQLAHPVNYRKFYWTPDFNTYGFATKSEIEIGNAEFAKMNEIKRKKEAKLYHK